MAGWRRSHLYIQSGPPAGQPAGQSTSQAAGQQRASQPAGLPATQPASRPLSRQSASQQELAELVNQYKDMKTQVLKSVKSKHESVERCVKVLALLG